MLSILLSVREVTSISFASYAATLSVPSVPVEIVLDSLRHGSSGCRGDYSDRHRHVWPHYPNGRAPGNTLAFAHSHRSRTKPRHTGCDSFCWTQAWPECRSRSTLTKRLAHQ